MGFPKDGEQSDERLFFIEPDEEEPPLGLFNRTTGAFKPFKGTTGAFPAVTQAHKPVTATYQAIILPPDNSADTVPVEYNSLTPVTAGNNPEELLLYDPIATYKEAFPSSSTTSECKTHTLVRPARDISPDSATDPTQLYVQPVQDSTRIRVQALFRSSSAKVSEAPYLDNQFERLFDIDVLESAAHSSLPTRSLQRQGTFLFELRSLYPLIQSYDTVYKVKDTEHKKNFLRGFVTRINGLPLLCLSDIGHHGAPPWKNLFIFCIDGYFYEVDRVNSCKEFLHFDDNHAKIISTINRTGTIGETITKVFLKNSTFSGDIKRPSGNLFFELIPINDFEWVSSKWTDTFFKPQ